MATLTFASKDETTEFVYAAFPNCIVDEVVISRKLSTNILDTVGRVADSVVINGALLLDGTISTDESLRLIRKFRKVKVRAFIIFLLQCTDCV